MANLGRPGLTGHFYVADASPLFQLVSALREWIAVNPVPPTAAAKRRSFELEAATHSTAPAPTPLRLKITLLWSHHLLASEYKPDLDLATVMLLKVS